MNWGYGITILTISFVCFMTFLVVGAFRQNVDLVTEDYYKRELEFQHRIETQKNQRTLTEPIVCIQKQTSIRMEFPEEMHDADITGSILMFCPSDAANDITMPLRVIKGVQLIDKSRLRKKQYRLQMDYAIKGKHYYYEKDLMIY